MSTCQNPQSPNTPFVNNPESLIRGANAAKQQAAAAASRAALKASAPSTPATMPEPPPKDQKWTPSCDTDVQSAHPNTEADFLRMMLESQHNGILLAQQERAATAEHMTHTEEASAARIARLEDAILLLLA
ncbi:hypothetical protein PCASD_24115 [Puccinia coronata f. sp. avenae]|uniref:Uncharacterized protein n=1 Tax=Puccinia coronata f. sp. avenae TaxID=200324 RepID=A0A2N5TNV8_9BASI|nr:hypothetical protein PCASD_24115 [Puccinia coronata f. sp. avenae]